MIGREWEKQELLRRYQRKKAEFVAVYGRRRVGKTFLIDKTLEGKITFRHAGLSPEEHAKTGELSRQLSQFWYTMQRYHAKTDHCPASWIEAFYMLETWLEEVDDGSRQVVFLDELPWLDTQDRILCQRWKASGTTGDVTETISCLLYAAAQAHG